MDVTKRFVDPYFLRVLQTVFKSDHITDEMCKKVTAFCAINKDISNLSGIEYFENLEYINIAYNNVRILDLTKNLKLKEVYCCKNCITQIRLPKTHLKVVSSYGNSDLLKIEDGLMIDRLILNETQLINHRNTRKKNNIKFATRTPGYMKR